MGFDSDNLPLGKETEYRFDYDASLLVPIDRLDTRASLGIDAVLPFKGEDIWNAYELSWLSPSGKPIVAMAEFRFPCESPSIVESKSFKLYLNSFNQTRFEDRDQVESILRRDLSSAAGGEVDVSISCSDSWSDSQIKSPIGVCLDNQEPEIRHYQPEPSLLRSSDKAVKETLYSHLLRSLCPVTGQPDWATLLIEYEGGAIEHESLLAYIISYRQHQDFHEHCVERIFIDIMRRCKPIKLTVSARYLRRGGLDINPLRSTNSGPYNNDRFTRQ